MEINDWILVDDNAKPVSVGQKVTDFRGETDIIVSGTPPHKPSSTGYVEVEGGRYYAGVFGLHWLYKKNYITLSENKDYENSPENIAGLEREAESLG